MSYTIIANRYTNFPQKRKQKKSSRRFFFNSIFLRFFLFILFDYTVYLCIVFVVKLGIVTVTMPLRFSILLDIYIDFDVVL